MQKIDEPVMLFAIGLLCIVAVIALIVGVTSIIAAVKRQPQQFEQIAAKQLHFAAVVLTGLGLLFALSMAMFFWGGETDGSLKRGREMFDACKTIIPPIVTLILGYYFGKTTEQPGKGGAQPGAISSNAPPAPAPAKVA